jgi:hypothetical protein
MTGWRKGFGFDWFWKCDVIRERSLVLHAQKQRSRLLSVGCSKLKHQSYASINASSGIRGDVEKAAERIVCRNDSLGSHHPLYRLRRLGKLAKALVKDSSS